MPVKKSDSKIKKPLKILLYGKSGVGKTHLALSASPGATLIFDTESGSDFFEGRKGFAFDYWTDEDGLKTTSVRELNKAIDYLEKDTDCKKYKTFILDVASDIWDGIQAQRSEYKDEVASKRGASIDERNEAVLLSFNQKDWGDIKRIWKNTIARIKTLPQNVILIAREKEIVETLPNGEIRSTGKYTYEGEKNLIYAVDFAIRMTTEEKGGKRIAIVDKSRNHENLPNGKVYESPTFKMFDDLVNSMNEGKKATVTNVDEGNVFIEEDELSVLQSLIISNCKKLGGSKNEDLMNILKQYEKSGNPSNIKDLEVLKKLKLELVKFITEKGE